MPHTGSHYDRTSFEPPAPCCSSHELPECHYPHTISSPLQWLQNISPILLLLHHPLSKLLISSLAHSPPLSISTIHLGQGFPSHLFLLRPYKRHLFIFPPKQFPSPCTIYLLCIFSIFLYWDGRTQLYEQESESLRRMAHGWERR